MIETGDLHQVVSALMTTVETAASRLGVELPDRRVLPAGGAVYDCPMVAVSVTGLTAGLPDSTTPGGLVPCSPAAWSTQLELAIVRTANERPTGPRGELPPEPRDIEADLACVSADMAVLLGAVNDYVGDTRSGTASITIGQPQGGLIATVASTSVPLWP